MGKRTGQSGGEQTFKLSDSCKLVLREGDITRWHVDGKSDAIVNAAHEWLLGGGGVDGAVHRAAGKGLLKHCSELPDCPPGQAVCTPLRVHSIIHTVGPRYPKPCSKAQAEQTAETLRSAYSNSLRVARSEGIKYIAFPALSCGINGYPLAEAAEIALETVKEEAQGFNEIDFLLFTPAARQAWAVAVDKAGLEPWRPR